MRVLLAKNLRGLYPVDDAAEEVLKKIGQGEIVTCEVKRPRNINHHRLFWALMTLVHGQLDDEKYPTVEDLVTEVKITTGHYTRRVIQFEGQSYNVLTPKSISFAAMDQTIFDAFFQRVVDWVCSDVLPGVREEDLRNELEIMVGVREVA